MCYNDPKYDFDAFYKRVISEGRGMKMEKERLDEARKLYNILMFFLQKHKLKTEDAASILRRFVVGDFLGCIGRGLSWGGTTNGYDYFYFLNLRWLTYCSKNCKDYSMLFKEQTAINELRSCVKWSNRPHSNKISRDHFLFLKKIYNNIGEKLIKDLSNRRERKSVV